ncbi:MAG: S8 family peptidase [Woeseiaceae bacterium]
MTVCLIRDSRRFAVLLTLGLALYMSTGTAIAADEERPDEPGTYLVQAGDVASAMHHVNLVGGSTSVRLPIIKAVGAQLTANQHAALSARPDVRIYDNAEVALDGRKKSKGTKKQKGNKSKNKDDDADKDADGDSVNSGSSDGTLSDPGSWASQSYDASDNNDEEAEEEADTELELTADYARTTQANGFLDWSELARTIETIDYEHPLTVSAPEVHQLGIKGKGITVGVIDTGLWWEASTLLAKGAAVFVDVTGQDHVDDANGHGTHVASIIASDRPARNGIYEGIAPASDLAIFRAFRADGSASYLDVIHAIDVAVSYKDKYNIRVLNLSFSATPQSHYWDDPLNQAVMAAWQEGIVVVASAGNSGPEPMTIGVPGNVPYIITVGAMTDNYSPYEPTDDRLASFSSAGPTFEGFVKPDVIAPGGHVVSSMPFDSYTSLMHPESMLDTERNFAMSGTSQAAAIVSGVVALMLENDPTLTPDEVKCRLMASAAPAVDHEGKLAYTIFQQGAGLVNALGAVNSSATQCANRGLNVAQDLKGEQHFGGRANQNEDGEYYLMDDEGERLEGDGYVWSRAYMWSQGYVWSRAYMWSQGYVWSRAYTWSQAYLWSRSVPWVEGAVFSSGLTETMSVNKWVEHE